MSTSFYYAVPCPQCGALKGQPCHTTGGNLTRPHEQRKAAWREKEGKFK
jgi:hypothetical protein